MVGVDEAVVAKLKKNGKVFEILVDSDAALAFKEGKDIDIRDILAAENVFSDAKKGFEVSDEDLNQTFGTTYPLEAAKKIIKEGVVPETKEHKQADLEQKRKKIIHLIHRNAVEPKNHNPIPEQRIADAMDSAKVEIDPKKSAEEHLQDVLHKINPIIPIKFEIKELQVKIPVQTAKKAYGILKSLGKMKNEQWTNDGSLLCTIEIPGGMEGEFYDKLNDITHGNNHVEIINTK